MMRPFIVTIAWFIAVAACGGSEDIASSTAGVEELADPRSVALDLVEALIDGEYQATEGLVDERHLAMLTSVERGTSREVAAMLRAGLPDDVRRDFWESFAESLPSYTGESIARVQVGSVTDRYTVEGAEFASVDVFVANGRVEWIMRKSESGWLLDLFASFGTGFLPNLRAWFAFIGTDGDAAFIRDEFELEIPSLKAGLERLPLGPLEDDAREAADELLRDFGG